MVCHSLYATEPSLHFCRTSPQIISSGSIKWLQPKKASKQQKEHSLDPNLYTRMPLTTLARHLLSKMNSPHQKSSKMIFKIRIKEHTNAPKIEKTLDEKASKHLVVQWNNPTYDISKLLTKISPDSNLALFNFISILVHFYICFLFCDLYVL